MIETILSLQIASGLWLPQEITTYDACMGHAIQLAGVARDVKANGGHISIEYAGREVEVTGIRCEPIDCEQEPTS